MVSLDIGTTVDRRYLLKREIARGGAGAVFEAEHIYTKRSVALKLLLPEQRLAAEPRARLLREALALSAARHPGVVAALDAGETEDGTPYLVLELLEGRSLEGILAVRRRIAAAEVAWVGAAICDALGAAHQRGIIHRDIKPSNVFVARDEQGREVTKLFDFGVASVPLEATKLTQVGGLLGTPEYMAPEQLLAREVDARTDLYAVGVTLYECLAGVVPFEGSFGEVLLKVSTQPLTPLSQKVPDIPPQLAQVIEQALSREPGDRLQDARSMAQALRAAAPAAPPGSLLGIRQGPPPVPARPGAAMPAAPGFSATESTSHAGQAGAPRPVAVPPPLPATRRRFPRAPYVTPVRIIHGQTVLEGRSEDVSVGGLLVLAPQAFEQAQLVKVRFALPMTGRVIEIDATARWVKAAGVRGAVGLQFASLAADAHEVIDRYVTMMGGE